MKQLLKILLILLYSPPSQCTDVKTCFLVLWFNCEFMIETGNNKKKHKTKCLPIHDFQFNYFKTKCHVCSLFKKKTKKEKKGKELT